MSEGKTLKEHLKAAAAKRWEGKTAEERSAHAQKMNAARWKKQTPKTQKDTRTDFSPNE